MKEKYSEVKEDVLDETKSIDETLGRLREVRKSFDSARKDYSTEPAMGTYLMNFYNGVENILKRISKEYYSVIPRGGGWHKELLLLSTTPPEGKIAIFEEAVVERLHRYLGFRHRFVSGYGFQLNGEKMLDLIDNIDDLWAEIKKGISLFWERI
jgi:hypothetical protein